MGLTAATVGLIPAAGGTKELLLRLGDAKAAFDLVRGAKVSGSAAHARELGLLRPVDGVSMNYERLVADAKAAALALAPNYAPALPPRDIPVASDTELTVDLTGYDAVVAGKLAYVLSRRTASEQDLLDLEREAFLSLCGDPRTIERIQHMLKTGKPLRN
jgi:3-hydroxyacyl-CoA dehydrogenase